jgi:hypothetical protein
MYNTIMYYPLEGLNGECTIMYHYVPPPPPPRLTAPSPGSTDSCSGCARPCTRPVYHRPARHQGGTGGGGGVDPPARRTTRHREGPGGVLTEGGFVSTAQIDRATL